MHRLQLQNYIDKILVKVEQCRMRLGLMTITKLQ